MITYGGKYGAQREIGFVYLRQTIEKPGLVPVGAKRSQIVSLITFCFFKFKRKFRSCFSRLKVSFNGSDDILSNIELSFKICSIFSKYSVLLTMTTPLPLSGFIM